MAQSQHSLIAFDTLFKRLELDDTPPARVIELGTGRGGLTAFLHLYSIGNGSSFTTRDRPELIPDHARALDLLSVDRRRGNVIDDLTVVEEIRQECRKAGFTVLLCDSGHKAREIAAFAPFLKSGDILLAHDYAPDAGYFAHEMKDRLWCSHEIFWSGVEARAPSSEFEPLLEEFFQRTAWICLRRRE